MSWRKVADLETEGVIRVEDGNHGEYRPRAEEFSTGTTSFIRAADMDGGRVLFESAEKIADSAATRIRKGHGKPGDVLFSHKGTVGKLAVVAEDAPPFVCSPQTTFWRSLNPEVLDQRYLYCFLRSPDFSEQWESRKGETDMADYVSLTAQRELKVHVPSLEAQRSIARIVSAFDDKIELNRRLNRTLEALTHKLFKSWFVDFDPVVAKSEGRKPFGISDELAALFPSEFEELACGPIPKGWMVTSIYEVADVVYGAPFASKHFNTVRHGIPLVRIRDLQSESPGIWTPEVHRKGYLIRQGDIVVGMDGEFRAYLWGGPDAWLNQRVCVFVPKKGFPAAFLHNTISPQLAEVEATETATTVIHLGKNDIDRFVSVVPHERVLMLFKGISDPWYERIIANKRQSRSLAAMRDLLLPKLLSGELSVPAAERVVDAAL